MPIKKSELYSSIWEGCDELRGSMDASQYKDYVLVLLFVKYVSDKYSGHEDSLIVIPEGGSYDDMLTLDGKKSIGEGINVIIGKLAEANQLKGVIDQADFNDETKLGHGQAMVDTLSKLVKVFDKPELDFSKNRADGDDLLGDAYEYLMRHFATQSGKSKGQFYTPAEVSRVIAKVVGIHKDTRQDQTIYDPTCGSGSLLLKAADEAPHGISIYGQERDNATSGLAKMNMFLHDKPGAEIAQGNTLTSPHYTNKEGGLRTFDFVVANPPFSDKAWKNGLKPEEDKFGRFEYGIPPSRNGDYAFLLHVLKSMNSTGKGAIILPHGVLFRGNSEADIRRNLVRRGFIKGIIGLPSNLFFGTGIPASIIVLDKENAHARKGVFIIDASKGFVKDGNKNRLRHQDIRKIVDVFNSQVEVDKYSRNVSMAEIEANDYNLNIPRYIDSTDSEDLQDIDAHLKGGIPNRDIEDLSSYWQVCPTLKLALFAEGDRVGYSRLAVGPGEVKTTICANQEFALYTKLVKERFEKWLTIVVPRMNGLKRGDSPKAYIESIANEILTTFLNIPLIDQYDVYQYLMNIWSETMQDDVYMIVSEDWQGANKLRLLVREKDKEKSKKKEKTDFVIGNNEYKADLIPPKILIARCFPEEQKVIDNMKADVAIIEQAIEEMKGEYGGEDGLLNDVTDDNGKIKKGAVKDQLKAIRNDSEAGEERKVLTDYLVLMDKQSDLEKRIKDAQNKLDLKAAAKYPQLTESEIKNIVVDDKWVAALTYAIVGETERINRALTDRIIELTKRYESPLPVLVKQTDALRDKVDDHLRKMGFSWT